MISKRGLVTAGALGAGSVLLAAGSAFACNINDFDVQATASCDTASGKAVVSVTDKDASGTPADISVTEHGASDVLGTAHFDHPTGQGQTKTIPVPWKSGGQWDVHVDVDSGNIHIHKVASTTAAAPASACAAPSSTAPASSHPATPSASPSAATPAPSTSASGVAAKGGATPVTSPGTTLAETGGGSDTGLIAGIAAALIAVGGGALVMRRRAAGARH